MFEIKDLKYKEILNIPSLTLDKDVSCIVGASGAGKSTLLRMLNQLLEPDFGTICYNGEMLASIPPVQLRRKVSMLGQTPILHGGTLAEELQLPANLCGYDPPGSDEMYKALETVRLDKPLNDWCDNFSGGEKQRVCLARLLLTKAETYLLDEPTAALDEETELDIFESLLQAAQRNGKTIVLVTHSVQIAQLLSDSIVCIEDGYTRGYEL